MLRRHALKLLAAGLLAAPLSAQPTTGTAREAVGAKLPVSIAYSLPPGPAQVLDGFIQEYAQTHTYLDIQVKNYPRPEDLYRDLCTEGSCPTLAIVENSWLPGIAQKQTALYPVEAWMPKEQFGFSWAIKNNAYVPLWDASQVNGTLYALPYFFTTKALIYNTDVLLKAGVKQAPATWDQVLAAAKKISDPKSSTVGLGLSLGAPDNPSAIARNFQLLVWQSGGEGLVGSNGASTAPAVQSVVEYLKKFAPGLAPLDGTAPTSPVGMYIGNVEDYLRLKSAGLPVKTAVIPGFTPAERTTETQSWALTMYRGGFPEKEIYKVQELAFFLLDFPQQRRWAEQTPYLAAHLKVFDNPFYRKERLPDHSNLRVFLNSVGKSRIVDTSGRLPEKYTAIGRALGGVLRGEKTTQELMPAQ